MSVEGPEPAWHIDLRSVGYDGYTPSGEFLSSSTLDPLCFSSNDTLIASFLTRAPFTTLPHRGQLNESTPLELHGVFLDAATARIEATREWPAPTARGVDLVATHDGQFIVVMPQRVALYSQALQLLKESALPSPTASPVVQSIQVSPQGRSLLLLYSHTPGDRLLWIDTDTLDTVRFWEEEFTELSVADNLIAIYLEGHYVKPLGWIHDLVIRNRAGSSRTICQSWTDCGGNPRFVSNEVLALWNPHGLGLFPPEGGKPLFRANFRQDEWIGPRLLRPSADGKRLAVAVSAHKGGSALLDINYHSVLKRIQVFDIPSRQWIYTLDAKKQKITTISGLALSRDGSRLAVLTDGVVEVYQLPE